MRNHLNSNRIKRIGLHNPNAHLNLRWVKMLSLRFLSFLDVHGRGEPVNFLSALGT